MSKIVAEYRPMEYIIVIDSPAIEAGNLSQITKEEVSSLFHELVHFYQDIALGYCQNLFIERNKIIANMNNAAPKISNIKVPIQVSEFDKHRLDLIDLYQAKNQSILWNSMQVTLASEIKYTIKEAELPENNPVHKYAKKVLVSIDGCNPFEFDGIVIMEGMASIYEKTLFPVESFSNYQTSLPYCLPVMLAKSICPSLTELEIGLICEISLEFAHAGYQFVWILEELIKKRGIKPQNIAENIRVCSYESTGRYDEISFIQNLFHNFSDYAYSLYNVCGDIPPFYDMLNRAYFAFALKMRIPNKSFIYYWVKEHIHSKNITGDVLSLVCNLAPIIATYGEKEDGALKTSYSYLGNPPYEICEEAWYYWHGLREIWIGLTKGMINLCPFLDDCSHKLKNGTDCSQDAFNENYKDCILGAMLTRLRLFGKKYISK